MGLQIRCWGKKVSSVPYNLYGGFWITRPRSSNHSAQVSKHCGLLGSELAS
jgi:hypothetical protein